MSDSKTIHAMNRGARWRKICTSLILILVLASQGHAAPIDEMRTALVKAGCVYHLTHMLTWPSNRFINPEAPLRIAFVGEDEQGLVTHFNMLLANHQEGQRRIEVLQFEDQPKAPGATSEALGRCHLVFFLGQAGDGREKMLASLAAAGVMTSGESDHFLDSGGIIAFLVKRQRLGIWLNKNRLDRTSITASAEFLQHAVIIKGLEGVNQ